MPKTYRITLTADQQDELKQTVSSHPKPYIRERAAGVLKVADGQSLRQVAYHQLLKRHAPETVKGWCETYLAGGLNALHVKPGRGRKPAFSPAQPNGSATGD